MTNKEFNSQQNERAIAIALQSKSNKRDMGSSADTFNLSEKIQEEVLVYDRLDMITTKDVKEFIKILKENVQIKVKNNYKFSEKGDPTMQEVFDFINQEQLKEIDKLAGEKLK